MVLLTGDKAVPAAFVADTWNDQILPLVILDTVMLNPDPVAVGVDMVALESVVSAPVLKEVRKVVTV